MKIALPGIRRLSAGGFIFLLALALASSRPSLCRADLVIEAPTLSAAPGDSGSFDVLITNTNAPGGASYNVSLFTLDFAVTGPAGVTLTSASISTVTPYVFVMPGVNEPGADPFVTSSTSTSFLASDSEFNPPDFFRAINPGDVFGLAHVFYSVDGTAPLGDRILHIGAMTQVADANLQSLPFTPVDGTLSVRLRGVPEPSAMALVCLGGITILAVRRRRPSRRVSIPSA